MEPLQPGDTIGILGGGQLGRMLAMAAARLGLRAHIYCPEEDCPASHVASAFTQAAYTDTTALDEFAGQTARVTFEFENIPLESIDRIEASNTVIPNRRALEVTQDRKTEKEFVSSLGIKTAPFVAISSAQDFSKGSDIAGKGAILKTRRFGYDGHGQIRLDDVERLANAWRDLGEQPTILEALIPFDFELSVVGVRDRTGASSFYDPPLNEHQNQILHRSTVPSPVSAEIAEHAKTIGKRIADELDYVGVLAVELFVVNTAAGTELLVNEIAPRVHNTGHWTMDACPVSQFENHIRAVSGWSLGTTERVQNAEMTNLIGHDVAEWRDFLDKGDVAVHLYGKRDVRPGRKMGHVTKLSPKT